MVDVVNWYFEFIIRVSVLVAELVVSVNEISFLYAVVGQLNDFVVPFSDTSILIKYLLADKPTVGAVIV